MNLDQLNKWLTLVANVGVVVGIVFVGYQIRLNTAAMRSSTQAQMVTNWNTITQDMATNPDLIRAGLFVNEHGLNSGQRDPVAAASVALLASSQFGSTEYEFMEAKRGNVDDEVWSAHVEANRSYIANNPYMLIAWTYQRRACAESFREFIDNLIIEICSHQTCPVGGRPEDWRSQPTSVAAPRT